MCGTYGRRDGSLRHDAMRDALSYASAWRVLTVGLRFASVDLWLPTKGGQRWASYCSVSMS